jgi:hypothetical protein
MQYYDPEAESRVNDVYHDCIDYPSVKKNIEKLLIVLRNNNVTKRQAEKIKTDYIESLVSPSILKTIKKKNFNELIREFMFPNEDVIVIGVLDIIKESKVITDEDFHLKHSPKKVLCVLCSKPQTGKEIEIFNYGLERNRVCFIGNLNDMIIQLTQV